jgi:hypothetical protein
MEHNGSVATLEGWFNPVRTNDTYATRNGIARLSCRYTRHEIGSVVKVEDAHEFPEEKNGQPCFFSPPIMVRPRCAVHFRGPPARNHHLAVAPARMGVDVSLAQPRGDRYA